MFARIKHWLTHVHEWETDQIISVYEGWDNAEIQRDRANGANPSYRKYVLECKTCGVILTKKV